MSNGRYTYLASTTLNRKMQKQIIIDLYSFFYKRMYKGTSYDFDKESELHNKQIDSFLQALQEDKVIAGPNWLIDYFSFQWNYWIDASTKTKKKVMLSWIIGQKALDRWNNKHESYQYYYKRNLYYIFEITTEDVRRSITIGIQNQQPDPISEAEESEKLVYQDGIERLVHCMEFTTLFHPQSPICDKCQQQDSCKEILFNSPELKKAAIKRGLYAKKA